MPATPPPHLTKNWISDSAFRELCASNTIATNGIRILNLTQRQQLATRCIQEVPADGTIGYASRRQDAINRMQAMRRIYLRDTIRHLKHCHTVIVLVLNLMTSEQKRQWAVANEQAGVIGEGTTRANERLAVIEKFEELKPTLYPEQEQA